MRQQDDSPDTRAVLRLGIAAFLAARVALVPIRFFDPDEFEHAHAGWCVSKGMLLYKDFFEHHTPWYYALVRPLFGWFRPEVSLEAARHLFIAGRLVSVLLAALSVWLVARIGRAWMGRRLGLLAAFLMVGQPLFLKKSLEMRPDMLALPFFLASLWALLEALDPALPSGRRCWWFLAAGLAQGAAVMCTQKMLFVLPGIAAGLVLWLVAEQPLNRLGCLTLFGAGVVLPGVATWAVFQRLGAGHDFIANNFLLNAHWKHIPTGQLIRFAGSSAPVLALAGAAGVAALRRLLAGERRDQRQLLLLGLMIWLFVSVALIPVAQMQYYLMPLPVVCLFAAAELLVLIELAHQRFNRRIVPLAVAAVSILPLWGLAMDASSTNRKQLARLRQVYETTAPTDQVMDGWQGTGVFRPHAFYYYFIHDELLLMLPPPRVDAFVDDLEAGRVRPALIAMDSRVAALGPRFLAFVNEHYTSRDGFFFYWAG